MITGFICFSYWIDFAFFWSNPSSVSWSCPIALRIVPALFLLTCILPLPELPCWLILKGEELKALAVISSLTDLDCPDDLAATEFAEIKNTVLEMKRFR